VIQSLHLCGLALLVGTIVLVDWQLLRGRALEKAAGSLAQVLAPWTRAGFAVMLATGLLQFFADTNRYLQNGAFRFKMGCLVLAVASHFTIRRSALAGSGKMPAALAGCLSLVLWSAVVLAARAIADFDA
jgi:hypothetical protein